MTLGQPFDHDEISPNSTYSKLNGEIEFVDDLREIGCMSPYSQQGSFIGFYGNWDVAYEGYDQIKFNQISKTILGIKAKGTKVHSKCYVKSHKCENKLK